MDPITTPDDSALSLPKQDVGVKLIYATTLTFDPGDKANSSLYISSNNSPEAVEAAISVLKQHSLWSDVPAKQVAEEQKEIYAAELTFIESVPCTVGGFDITIAQFYHPQYPSDEHRFELWKRALG